MAIDSELAVMLLITSASMTNTTSDDAAFNFICCIYQYAIYNMPLLKTIVLRLNNYYEHEYVARVYIYTSYTVY